MSISVKMLDNYKNAKFKQKKTNSKYENFIR
ncbi:hypothetical protein Deia_00276 [Candidatus Deianiraea vastatrix]|uniref:Uncharacterized protein n=1 Tax=Candidatus Deianiraea vastatrix TaxID=2163644 RepID=A0A5B8XCQ5_9RICK|nr:hypothetical protein Deia_00276 [Candidatus Deianiraea vastatrix]